MPAVHGEIVYAPKSAVPMTLVEATEQAQRLLESMKDVQV